MAWRLSTDTASAGLYYILSALALRHPQQNMLTMGREEGGRGWGVGGGGHYLSWGTHELLAMKKSSSMSSEAAVKKRGRKTHFAEETASVMSNKNMT